MRKPIVVRGRLLLFRYCLISSSSSASIHPYASWLVYRDAQQTAIEPAIGHASFFWCGHLPGVKYDDSQSTDTNSDKTRMASRSSVLQYPSALARFHPKEAMCMRSYIGYYAYSFTRIEDFISSNPRPQTLVQLYHKTSTRTSTMRTDGKPGGGTR